MNKIELNNLLINDLSIINEQLDKVKLGKDINNIIKKNIYLIRNKLKGSLDIKTHGSYSINNVYNFDDYISVDLIAIKHVSKKIYMKYQKEFDTNDHFVSCIICNSNLILFKKIINIYLKDKDVKVKWKEKNYSLPTSNEIITFKDSLIIHINYENQKEIRINLRTSIKHADYPLIICNKTMYRRTFTLEYTKIYKTLNKLTLKKLQLLYFYIRVKYKNKISKKRELTLKLEILQDLQLQLLKNKYFQIWLDTTFEKVFKSPKEVELLLESKLIYYKKYRKIDKLYRLIKLKNLKWVYLCSYKSIKRFLDFYLDFCDGYINNIEENYSNEIMFYYDSVAYLKNKLDTNNFSVKKNNKLYDEIDIKIITKTIYPYDKNNGLFLVFLKFFKFEII
ncbi:hypothetical protein SCORR_v1c03290 [Spiroplasma corruscae]|uniref:Uncharacterized protein n=1 Tax=Spiroplasma corruscae TaxID=216934 RepID=A0A222EPA7_9MOLU|nr:hypothetical protein [Spiroplasma corruscae]ASP28103.1 hypothetical protein SCORR_v1c03290 [Spiroplasma corruscae]